MALKRRPDRSPKAPCPLTSCMSLLSGAWSPNIVWYLSQGPRRFSELKSAIGGVSAKVLAERLREMEESGVLTRTVLPTSPPSVEYGLSDLGLELMPVIQAIVSVGERLKARRPAAAKAMNRRKRALAA